MGPSSLRRGDMSQESLRRTRFATFCVGNPRPPGGAFWAPMCIPSHPAGCRVSSRHDLVPLGRWRKTIVYHQNSPHHTTTGSLPFLVLVLVLGLGLGLVRSALLTFFLPKTLLRPNPATPVPLRRFGVPALKGGRLCAASARVLLTIGAQGRRTHTASCCATFFKQ